MRGFAQGCATRDCGNHETASRPQRVWDRRPVDFTPTSPLLGAIPERSPACEALITRIATQLEPHTDEIAQRLVDRIAFEMELVREDEDVREDLLAVARACASLLTSMTRTWSDPHSVPPPQDALAWSRSLGSRRLPMDALLRVFRIGQSGYHDVWHQKLASCDEDQVVVLEALKAMTAFTFTWVDALLEPVAVAYEEERERNLRGAHTVRSETDAAIVSGTPIDETLAGARLGYDLHRPHLAFVAWVESDAGAAATDRIEELAAQAAGVLGGASPRPPLILRVSPRIAHGWVAHGAIGDAELGAARDLLCGTHVQLAVGRPASAVDGFRSSHEEARRARRVARLLHLPAVVTRYADVAVPDLLTREPEVARKVVEATLGPLAKDDESARRLVGTLRVFLEEGQSFSRAARRLEVHENTVAYRVRRVLELTGQQDAGSLELRAAVELLPLLDVVEPTGRELPGSG